MPWPRPGGLLGSYRLGPPSPRRHWPDQSGYFAASCASAGAIAVVSAAISATAAIAFRVCMTVLPWIEHLERTFGSRLDTAPVLATGMPADGTMAAAQSCRYFGA